MASRIFGFYLFILMIIQQGNLSGQSHFTPTYEIQQAYQCATSLRLPFARQWVERIRNNDPENLLVELIENYIDFFELFIEEDEGRFKHLEKEKDKRLSRIKKGDKDSPYYRFCQAEILLQWAVIRLKFGQKLTAAREVYSAYILLEENRKYHHDFILNHKSLSIIRVLSESIPGLVRFLFGIEGSIERGTREIEHLYKGSGDDHTSMFRDEICVIYAYILYYQNNRREEAMAVLDNAFSARNINENPLISFVMASMAIKNGHNEKAINILKNRSKAPEYIDFHYLDFILGKLWLNKLDHQSKNYLEKFIREFKGRHYIKEALQKLAWYYLIVENDTNRYDFYIKRVLTEGHALIDEDKQAQWEAMNGNRPDTMLLKARLLFDGKLFEKSYQYLKAKEVLFKKTSNQTEYNYRMGRICQEMGDYDLAGVYFNEALSAQEKKSYYYSNSALQQGLILEKHKKYKEALSYIKQCLASSPDRYAISIHQKAKSAKLRIEEKIRMQSP
ncbi:MAG TPA: tetratricopeptide repeat protein [Saprospiraceae bacterium]|nr:tetratricopeptide repeat protein [Saprospiraceae bacterium]